MDYYDGLSCLLKGRSRIVNFILNPIVREKVRIFYNEHSITLSRVIYLNLSPKAISNSLYKIILLYSTVEVRVPRSRV